MLLRDFATIYMASYAKPFKKTWREDLRRLDLHILPTLGDKTLSQITALDIASLHAAMSEKPYMANRILEQLSKMFKLAVEWELLPENHRLPTSKVRSYPERSRDRFVNQDEMERLATAINGARSRQVQALLWLYLLLGLRKNELLKLQWKDIDFKQREIRIERTKNGRVHYVQLSTEAVGILEAQPRMCEYVFPGRVPGASLTHFNQSWHSIREKAGLDDVTLHDLRRTVGSWLAQSGVSILLIGKVLNHRDSKSTEVYARFANKDVCAALESHGSVMAKFMKRETARERLIPPKNAPSGTTRKNADVVIQGREQLVVEARLISVLSQGPKTKTDFYRKLSAKVNRYELDRILGEMIEREVIEIDRKVTRWSTVRYRLSNRETDQVQTISER